METLTCNQTIVLLQLSRGTLRQEEFIGTYLSDLRLLERLDYIKVDEAREDGFELTHRGEERVELIKRFPPATPNTELIEAIRLIS